MKKVELLSPVGNIEMLYQAIHNGADAVYLAGNNYGARKFAKNFTNEELVKAISYAHVYGVKVYVTVNTLIFEEELKDVLDYVEFLHRIGVDALIMQDMGLIQIVLKYFPNLEIHASTQCHNHNKEIASLWKKIGITRVVFAREMSLEEIHSIDVDIEKEVFVYGALCVCYSGCCLFSSLNGGRSGNRGECVGNCRLPYYLIQNGKKVSIPGNYLLSTKELNTMDEIGQLIEAGVDSFKIEGRMKSPYYVGYVTRLYRLLIDKYYHHKMPKLSPLEIQNLKKLFNREFTKGYLFHESDIMNIQSSNHLGVRIGTVIQANKNRVMIKLSDDSLCQNDGIRFQNKNDGMMVNKLYNKKGFLTNQVDKGEICLIDNRLGVKSGDIVLKTIDHQLIQKLEQISYKKIPVCFQVKCFLGQKIKLKITDGIYTVTEELGKVEAALKREVTEAEIKRQFCKLGNTPFMVEKINIQKSDNIFINLKDMNELRRNAIDKLIAKRSYPNQNFIKKDVPEEKVSYHQEDNIRLNVLVRTEEQLKCCLEYKVNDIYVTDYALYEKYKNIGNIYYRTKRITSNYTDFNNEKLLVGELGSVSRYGKSNTLISDYYLNVTNHHSIEFLTELGVNRITLSVELNDTQIKNIMKENYPVEVIIYGRLELMVMKYCPLKKCLDYCNKCQNSQDKFSLEDSLGKQYPMIRENCITHIMHYKNMDKMKKIEKYIKMEIRNYRMELFDESADETQKLIQRFKKITKEKKP